MDHFAVFNRSLTDSMKEIIWRKMNIDFDLENPPGLCCGKRYFAGYQLYFLKTFMKPNCFQPRGAHNWMSLWSFVVGGFWKQSMLT